VALAVTAMVATGCSSDAGGGGFDADPGPVDPVLVAALGDDIDPTAVPEVQRNFLALCVDGLDNSTDQLAPLESAALVAVCGCSYDAIVEDVRAGADGATATAREDAAFAAFQDLEDDLRTGGDLDPVVQRLVAACIRGEAGL